MTSYIDFWKVHGETVRPILDALAESVREIFEVCPPPVENGFQISITLGHSDLPEVNVRWGQPDGISRVVQVIVRPLRVEETQEAYIARIEAGAWLDVDNTANGTRFRLWRHDLLGDRLPTVETQQRGVQISPKLRDRVSDAINSASRWSQDTLREKTMLPSETAIGPVSQLT
jgi:hypothetical protein